MRHVFGLSLALGMAFVTIPSVANASTSETSDVTKVEAHAWPTAKAETRASRYKWTKTQAIPRVICGSGSAQITATLLERIGGNWYPITRPANYWEPSPACSVQIRWQLADFPQYMGDWTW